MSTEAETLRLRNEVLALQNQLARLNRSRSADELNELSAAFARADAVAAHFGEKATQALPGESPIQYRRRLAQNYQKHSARFAKADLSRLDSATLEPIEEAIYADAVQKALSPDSYKPGELRAIRSRDESGRVITKFVGDNMAWMQVFMTPSRVGKFIRPEPPR